MGNANPKWILSLLIFILTFKIDNFKNSFILKEKWEGGAESPTCPYPALPAADILYSTIYSLQLVDKHHGLTAGQSPQVPGGPGLCLMSFSVPGRHPQSHVPEPPASQGPSWLGRFSDSWVWTMARVTVGCLVLLRGSRAVLGVRSQRPRASHSTSGPVLSARSLGSRTPRRLPLSACPPSCPPPPSAGLFGRKSLQAAREAGPCRGGGA